MPFAGYADFDACVKANGDASDPPAYCAAIMRQVEGKSEEGYEFKDLPDEAKKLWIDSFKESFGKNDETGSGRIAWATVLRKFEQGPNGAWNPMKVFNEIQFKSIHKAERVIFGAASVALVDSENELITEQALKSAFKSYVERGHVLFYHRNIPVGEVLPSYKGGDGTAYKSEVKDGKLNIAVRLYKDTQIANEVWDAIERGELRAFSIGGQVIGDAVKVCTNEDCSQSYDRIDKIDLHEISIVPNPANDASYFNIIKSKVEPMRSKAEEKLEKLSALIIDEKMKTVNCPKFTDEALKIIKGDEPVSTLEDRVKMLEEKLQKVEHQGECPEGHHMVDGECVPMDEKSKDGAPKMTDEKKVAEPKQEEKKEAAPVAPAPAPAPVAPKSELDALRAEVNDLRSAIGVITSATKEIAGLKASILESPASKEVVETEMRDSGAKVAFKTDEQGIDVSDWTTRLDNSSTTDSFQKRMDKIAQEYGASTIPAPVVKSPEPAAKTESQTELQALRASVSDLTTSLKSTMNEIHVLKEKAEIGRVKAQVSELQSAIKSYADEVGALKESLAKAPAPQAPAPIQAPAEKRTIIIPEENQPMVYDEVVSMDGGSRDDSFKARMRKLEKEFGLTR